MWEITPFRRITKANRCSAKIQKQRIIIGSIDFYSGQMSRAAEEWLLEHVIIRNVQLKYPIPLIEAEIVNEKRHRASQATDSGHKQTIPDYADIDEKNRYFLILGIMVWSKER